MQERQHGIYYDYSLLMTKLTQATTDAYGERFSYRACLFYEYNLRLTIDGNCFYGTLLLQYRIGSLLQYL